MSRNEPENVENPWKVQKQREIYKNEWMQIREFDVIRPDGKPGIYAYMNCRPAIGVIPIDDQGFTWLVGQYRFPLKQYSWEIPTGMGDDEEEPEATARRELSEETGLSARLLTKLGYFHTSNSLTNEVATLFLARECTPGNPHYDPTEVLQIKRVKLDEAINYCHKGIITDAMSIIGLNWATSYLQI